MWCLSVLSRVTFPAIMFPVDQLVPLLPAYLCLIPLMVSQTDTEELKLKSPDSVASTALWRNCPSSISCALFPHILTPQLLRLPFHPGSVCLIIGLFSDRLKKLAASGV